MDDTLRELVSRAVDDDLDALEAAELERRAIDEPALAVELDDTRRLRDAVGRLAETMEPPPALDALVEPLRQGPPAEPPRVRPAVRWLGLAAVVVLGATVALEVARRNPTPTGRPEPTTGIRSVDDEAIFQLAPLPTANPEEERPFGAAERLLAERPPEPEAPAPEPLEVIGPLAMESSAGEAVTEPEPGAEARPRASADAPRERPKAAPLDDADSARGAVRDASSLAAAAERARPGRDVGDGVDVARAVEVTVNGRPVWQGRTTACEAGRTPAVIVVRDAAVVAVEPAADVEPCRPEGLLGSRVASLEDGRHAAEIVVGPGLE